MNSSLQTIDYVVLVGYLLLMAGVGAYFTRFIRVGSDFLKGGNRVEWWIAGMASFMSGFSVWTFTGGAGFAYREGAIGMFLMFSAAFAFIPGYLIFAARWRRSRVTTVVEYIRSRFGDNTHKLFSTLTAPSQLMFASVKLFALAAFMSVALGGFSVPGLIVICGLIVLAYTVLGGYWAVCFTDMFQFMFLFPVACLVMVLSLVDVGGFSNFAANAPAEFLNPFAGEYGLGFLVAFTASQIIGYNNFQNAQRYFNADTERSARKIALLCITLFTLGAVVFYLPPLVARVVLPELGAAANGLKQPSEAAYIAMGMRVLPPGLVGVLLAAMLASSMASLSASNHIITGVLAKDLYQSYWRKDASERQMLVASRIASVAVGAAMILLALVFASGTTGIFTLLIILESVFLFPLGLPLLYGMLVRRAPWWSAVCAFLSGATASLIVNFYLKRMLGWNLNETYVIGVPVIVTTVAFFVPALLFGKRETASDGESSRRVAEFFDRLQTPIDTERELGAASMTGREQLALVGRVTTGIGLVCFLMPLFAQTGRDQVITLIYAVATTLVGLAFVVAGRTRAKQVSTPEIAAPLIGAKVDR